MLSQRQAQTSLYLFLNIGGFRTHPSFIVPALFGVHNSWANLGYMEFIQLIAAVLEIVQFRAYTDGSLFIQKDLEDICLFCSFKFRRKVPL
jgi:hypothetical protein